MRAEDVLEDDAGEALHDVRLRVEATIEGGSPPPRLRGHRPAARRQPELPAVGDKVGRASRRPRPHRSRRPALRRRLPPIEVIAPEGCLLNAGPPAAVVAGNTETSSRVADLVVAALGATGPRAGPGDDEQSHPRGRELHLLRDARRRPGRLPGGRRSERDPRGDVEHPQHAGRGAGDRIPAARARARGPPRQRGRRGHGGGDGIVREVEALEPMRFSLLGERRRHRPPGATVAATGPSAAICSTGSRCPARRRVTCVTETCCESRPRRRARIALRSID